MRTDPRDWMTVRVSYVKREIRNLYYHIRTTRSGKQDAYRRRYYRKISKLKSELLSLGQSRRDVLDLVACCRSVRCRVDDCPHCGRTVHWKEWV